MSSGQLVDHSKAALRRPEKGQQERAVPSYQVCLNRALMLLLLLGPDGSFTVVVMLSGPPILCSALIRLCHCGSPLTVAMPAESVVPVCLRLKRTDRSVSQTEAPGGIAATAGGGPCRD